MLSAREQEALTRVGPGTPMGDLLRRYWHPVAATCELEARPTKRVRILGEDLVVFRPAGGYGVVAERCPLLADAIVRRSPARVYSARPPDLLETELTHHPYPSALTRRYAPWTMPPRFHPHRPAAEQFEDHGRSSRAGHPH